MIICIKNLTKKIDKMYAFTAPKFPPVPNRPHGKQVNWEGQVRKLSVVLAILLLAFPAISADWAFTGSVRMATWYADLNMGGPHSEIHYPGFPENNDRGVKWYMQGNSRFDARVREESVSGRVEFGLGSSGDGSDPTVTTRLAYGTWKFADGCRLKIGKDDTPITTIISNQFYWDDGDLLALGNFWGSRVPQIGLSLYDLELAFLSVSYGSELGNASKGINGASGGNPNSYIPRIEANYTFRFDTGYIRPFGGFQWYEVQSTKTGAITGDFDVFSWAFGVTTTWNIGDFSVSAQVSYGMNEGNVPAWTNNLSGRANAAAYLKGGDHLANTYTLQAAFVPAWAVNEWLRLEAGIGYRSDNANDAPGASKPINSPTMYLQGLITLAPGVYLCPEIGYSDFGRDRSGHNDGGLWYAGAKWQIDF